MDILHNDERSCFLKRGVELNIKLEISPNILNLILKNLTLNPYALHMFIMNPPAMAFHEFSKHMPTHVKALHVYRRSKVHLGRV
jgi:hypothetical protein